MGSGSGSTGIEWPADEYSRLWELGAPIPDVFAFLASHRHLPLTERLAVLLVDQRKRWQRGQALPLRVYLSTFPEIAERGEFIRALVDGEREHRRQSAGRLNETVPEPLEPLSLSETPTEAVVPSPGARLDPCDHDEPRVQLPPTTSIPVPSVGLPTTRVPPEGSHTGSPDDLGFDLDERHQLRSEAEVLKAMLDAVRFTLVRRVGTGGMGVVYEAYDRNRGELVALKTMRRTDPTALARFKHEFRSLADISHPNLVNLYELFAVDDRWFFTMELVEGCDFLRYARWNAPSSSLPTDPPSSDGAIDELRTLADAAVDPPREIRPMPFDEGRLREALRQLAEGVEALHLFGKLHRDIKPTNVLVTAEGRVVLLDFGLTADLERSGLHRTRDRQIVGTAAHMSPEQAAGLSITPSSDWYSVGVMLYEVLTGRLPFIGPPQEIIGAKQNQVPTSPSKLVEGLPEDLVRLCVELLDREPAKRPTGREIIARLTGLTPDAPEWPDPSRPLPLIGRARHLHVLDSAFTSLIGRRTQSIFVFGRTGTGKTTLIRSFLQEISAQDEAIVLSGRCYERETVPYKALDSLIDALARHLKGLPSRDVATLLTTDAAYLARLFPVLESVPLIAAARVDAAELPDQQEVRRRAFAVLRELLRRLGNKVPLVLAIDDLQWGDADSAILLSDLLCSTQSPMLLFVGSFRSEDAKDCPFLAELRQSIAGAPALLEHRELAVEALTQSEARELTLALLGRDDAVARAQAHVVARESSGNPLFIDELVRHIQGGEPIDRWEAIGQLDLDEVLWERIQRQPDDAQRLLGTVAVSGRPIRQALAFQAADLGFGARVALASLRTARLIRQIGPAHDDEVEIYHDRIRETIVAHLPPDRVRWHHERLALVLSTADPIDPQILAGHHRGAGSLVRASEYYARGADQAAAALAFDHAARLYRAAIDLYAGPADLAIALRRKLGDALANAGRGAEAAQAYLEAAATAPAAETLDLKRLASTQLLMSGHLDDGLALLRTLLDPLGIRMPATPRRALVSLLWHRAILRLRGLRFTPREESRVPAMDLKRIDLCWSAVAGLSMFEPIRGADFQTRGLLMALRAGEPFRVTRALAMEAAHQAAEGLKSSNRVATLLNAAGDLAARIDSPHARGMVDMVRGVTSLLFGRWKAARTALEQAEELFRNHCTGVAWERDTGHNFTLWALFQLGEVAELRRRWTVLSREARERGDLYASRYLNVFYATLIKLAGDQRPELDAETEVSLTARGGRPLNLQLTPAFDALMYIDLYHGDVTRAWARLSALWPDYSRSLLFQAQLIRIQLLELRARTAVAAAERSQQPEPLLALATRDAQALEREGQAGGIAHAHYVRAAIAACQQDAFRATEELTRAAELYDSADMPLSAQTMRYRLGEIDSSVEARLLREQAENDFKEQGIVAPTYWARMMAPGFCRISSESTETSF
jgi:eukaryotic-like serine/threonine-protein kinase